MSTPCREYAVCRVNTSLQAQERIRTAPRWLRAAAALLVLPLAATAWASALPVSTTTPTLAQVQQKMAGLAVPFEANQGQFAPEVAFAARTFAGTLFVTRDGRIVHALAGKPEQKNEAKQNKEVTAADSTPDHRTSKSPMPRGPGWALVESLKGAGELAPSGSQPSATSVSRFNGGAAPNQTSNIATFDRVALGEAWPGVSVELAAHGSNVEKLFTVAPGTNPKSIRMGVAGAKRLRLDNDGSLIVATGNGNVAFTPPVAFQEIEGHRTEVAVHYKLLADNSYRFETSTYDRSQPLVIDPLLQSTYLGGSAQDQAFALALDASGNVLVVGYTASTNFPGTAGGAQAANGGGSQDAFVARLSSSLTTLVQATYLGGSSFDQATELALDASGNVLIVGYTTSTNFPGTTGGVQPTSNGGGDAFIARLSSNLQMLTQATYLGGSNADIANTLALDASGNVFVGGYTASTNFPGTTGGAQPANAGGSQDVFVARLSSNLQTLVQATYLGGSDTDQAFALALQGSGNVLVTGTTGSTNFPGTIGGAQPANGGGGRDIFVARLSGSLTTLMQATYLGGSSAESASVLALDATGNVLVAGDTGSTNFPGTSGGAQLASGGSADAFVARLSSNLTTLVQATYLGGSDFDQANALALDPDGNVLVAGLTNSTNFPGTSGAAQAVNGGNFDAFVARLTSSLTTLVQATYLGGNAYDAAFALAVDASGNVLIAGSTQSTNLPGTTGAAQPSSGGNGDVFVAKLSASLRLSNDRIFLNGFE